jgi:hypothetical protein
MTAPTRPSRFFAAALVSLAAISLVACGDDDDSSSDTTTAAVTADAVVIEVDADSGTPGTQTVPLGTPVSFHVVTATEQEFHLHGYDVEEEGTDVTISFTADQAGSFELESHDTEELLFTLVVEA